MKNLINHFFNLNSSLILLFFFFPFLVLSQEDKRLALVIGNANYDKGPLENPVNDARLIAETLYKLNFDTILATNLETRGLFLDKINEYGDRREKYNVGLVFYAGHGVQIGGDNYLLPTKEEYASERDIEDNAVNVTKIMRYLEDQSDEVNILILDACRDNPYEIQWNATRSLKGNGLAKIPPPTGSLIAFSTDAGSTAPDGEGENSIYSLSLAKYMMEEDLSIYDVFNEVRAEVLAASNNRQRPVEENQLTGSRFYLNPSNFEDEFNEVDEIIRSNENLERGVFILENIIDQEKSNINAYRQLNYLYQLLDDNRKAVNIYQENKFITLNEYDFYLLAESYFSLKNYDSALLYINKSITIDSLDPDLYFLRGLIHDDLENYNLSKSDYFKTIKYDSSYSEAYNNLALIYEENNQIDSALYLYKQANKIIGDDLYFRNIAELFAWKYEIEDSALFYYNKALEADPENDLNHYYIAEYYNNLNNYSLAINFYSRAIELNNLDPRYFFGRGNALLESEFKSEAISDYIKSSELYETDEDKASTYNNIGVTYLRYFDDVETALKYYKLALNLYEDELYAQNIGGVYYSNKDDYDSAIYFLNLSIDINSKDPSNYSYLSSSYYERAKITENQDDYNQSLDVLNKGLEIDPENNMLLTDKALFYYYQNQYEFAINEFLNILKLYPDDIGPNYYLGKIYNIKNEYKDAIKYFTREIITDPDDPIAYIERGLVYQKTKEYNKALYDFNEAITLEPEDRNNYYYKINLFKIMGDYKSAYNVTNETIEMDIDDPQGYYVLAELFYNDGEVIDALENIIITQSKLERDNDYWISNMDGAKKELFEVYFFKADIAKKLNLDELYCESMIEASLLFENSDNKYDEEKYIEKLDIFNKSSLCQ